MPSSIYLNECHRQSPCTASRNHSKREGWLAQHITQNGGQTSILELGSKLGPAVECNRDAAVCNTAERLFQQPVVPLELGCDLAPAAKQTEKGWVTLRYYGAQLVAEQAWLLREYLLGNIAMSIEQRFWLVLDSVTLAIAQMSMWCCCAE